MGAVNSMPLGRTADYERPLNYPTQCQDQRSLISEPELPK